MISPKIGRTYNNNECCEPIRTMPPSARLSGRVDTETLISCCYIRADQLGSRSRRHDRTAHGSLAGPAPQLYSLCRLISPITRVRPINRRVYWRKKTSERATLCILYVTTLNINMLIKKRIKF